MVDPTEALIRLWGMNPVELRLLGGGMNSETWLFSHKGFEYVAKQVSCANAPDLLTGAETASTLADAGLVTGRPVRCLDGRLVAGTPAMAVLQHVPGRALRGTSNREQEWMGGLLAAVHLAGHPSPGPPAAQFAPDWVRVDLPGVDSHPWLVDVLRVVHNEIDSVMVTWSTLHTDPFPGAFIRDDTTDTTALIDWAGARRGPILYDLASAVMYLGGTHAAAALLDSYRMRHELAPDEMDHLDAFRRFREAVQGVYFAGRLARRDLTGVDGQGENEQGLSDARRRLRLLGLDL